MKLLKPAGDGKTKSEWFSPQGYFPQCINLAQTDRNLHRLGEVLKVQNCDLLAPGSKGSPLAR